MATERRRRGDAVDVHVDTVDAVDVGAADAVDAVHPDVGNAVDVDV